MDSSSHAQRGNTANTGQQTPGTGTGSKATPNEFVISAPPETRHERLEEAKRYLSEQLNAPLAILSKLFRLKKPVLIPPPEDAPVASPPPVPIRIPSEQPKPRPSPPARPRVSADTQTINTAILRGKAGHGFTGPGLFSKGRVMSAMVEESMPTVVGLVSSLLLLTSFILSAVTLVFLGSIVGPAAILMRKGYLGFTLINEFPLTAAAPAMTALATLFFAYAGYGIRDGSRTRLVEALLIVALVPPALSILLPSLSYPILAYAIAHVNASASALPHIGVDPGLLNQLFYLILAIEGLLLVMIPGFPSFNRRRQPLDADGKTSLIAILVLFILPSILLFFFSLYDTRYTDHGRTQAEMLLEDRLIVAHDPLRELSSQYHTGLPLPDTYATVKAVYDTNVRDFMKSGSHSRITLIQSHIPPEFSVPEYLLRYEEDFGRNVGEEAVTIFGATIPALITSADDGMLAVWMKPNDTTLLTVRSRETSLEELVAFASTLN